MNEDLRGLRHRFAGTNFRHAIDRLETYFGPDTQLEAWDLEYGEYEHLRVKVSVSQVRLRHMFGSYTDLKDLLRIFENYSDPTCSNSRVDILSDYSVSDRIFSFHFQSIKPVPREEAQHQKIEMLGYYDSISEPYCEFLYGTQSNANSLHDLYKTITKNLDKPRNVSWRRGDGSTARRNSMDLHRHGFMF